MSRRHRRLDRSSVAMTASTSSTGSEVNLEVMVVD